MRKPLFIKEPKWEEEKEWRRIVEFKGRDTDTLIDNHKRYKNVYYPASCLKNISIIYTVKNNADIVKYKTELEKFIAEHPIYKYVTICTELIN